MKLVGDVRIPLTTKIQLATGWLRELVNDNKEDQITKVSDIFAPIYGTKIGAEQIAVITTADGKQHIVVDRTTEKIEICESALNGRPEILSDLAYEENGNKRPDDSEKLLIAAGELKEELRGER
jgi:hypothetical protein